jgi:ABC-type xylose transport system permease subunit
MSAQTSTTGAGLPAGGPLSGAVWQRVRGGSSLLPIVAALVGIWIILGAVNPAFLAPENLVNLTLQSAPVGVIALGVVLVLLVGQIDLSVGSLSGLAAAVVAVGSVTLGWPVALAIAAALACGAVVGLGYGALSTRLGLPSFVFTLAGLLFLAGVQLRVLGPLGSINLPFESWFVRSVQQGFLPAGSPGRSWA